MISDRLLNIKLAPLFFSLFFFSCNNLNDVTMSGFTMGTTYEVKIKDFTYNKNEFHNSIDSVLVNINKIFSTYIIDSEISLINKSNSLTFSISKPFKYVLNKSLFFCSLSKGSYDITVAPLVEQWGFGKNKTQIIPNQKLISKHLQNIGFENIYVRNNKLHKKNKKLTIDLNSIAKGYAVDEIALLIKNRGFNNFLIEIGGEIKVSSDVSSEPWILGIQNPLSNSVIKRIILKNKSMATSGTYNNYFELDGNKFSHIINPKTGYPYNYKVVSATVITNDCIDADAFATMAMTLEIDDFLNIVNKVDGVECYLVEVDNEGKFIYHESINFKTFIE